MDPFINGYVTYGSYFIYQGERYGQYTEVRFSDAFLERVGELNDRNRYNYNRGKRVFHSVETTNGKTLWKFWSPGGEMMKPQYEYYDIAPVKDIEAVIAPVWYRAPKEMVKKRLSEGTWIWYVLPQTLFYIFALLASLITYDWPVVWVMGTCLYLRLAYIELSKGEFNRGW